MEDYQFLTVSTKHFKYLTLIIFGLGLVCLIMLSPLFGPIALGDQVFNVFMIYGMLMNLTAVCGFAWYTCYLDLLIEKGNISHNKFKQYFIISILTALCGWIWYIVLNSGWLALIGWIALCLMIWSIFLIFKLGIILYVLNQKVGE